MDRLAPTSGLPVLVVGAGPAGLMLTALSSLAGLAPLVVVDPDPDRREAAIALGADATIDPTTPDWQATALALTSGDGYDHLIEASGRPEGLVDALALAARAARILIYGVARPGEIAPVQPQQVYAKELTILGAALNPFTHARAIELLGELPLHILDPGRYPLERFEDAFEAQRRRAHLKVVVTP
jgi:threonine dehydrogenase-like Zn-dependent dehydrogenase